MFPFSLKPILVSPHGQIFFCGISFLPHSFVENIAFLESLLYIMGFQCDRSCPWSPCMTISLEVQLFSSSSSGLPGLRAPYLFCLMLLLHNPVSEECFHLLANSYMIFKRCLQNSLGSISVLGRFSRSLVHPNIENKHSGTFS